MLVCSICNRGYNINKEGSGLCIMCIANLQMLEEDSPKYQATTFCNLEYWKNEGILYNFFKYEFQEYFTFTIYRIQHVIKTIKLSRGIYKFLILYDIGDGRGIGNYHYVYYVITLGDVYKNTLNIWACKEITREQITSEMIYPVRSLQELSYEKIVNKNEINSVIHESVLNLINTTNVRM
jgi:hypothetical protein